MKIKTAIMTLAFAFTAGIGTIGVLNTNKKSEVKEAEAADYSSTIRIYVDLTWGNIDYVRVGGKETANNAVLTSSNAKYNQDLGKYVKDVSSGSNYDKMGIYFSQSSTWWEYQYNNGCIYIDASQFQPGYEFQIKNISHVSGDNPKYFSASVYRIGKIRDNAQNSTFYLVDGYSWHASRAATAYFWGGTASSGSYPGVTMIDSGMRIKAWVGSEEFSGLHIRQYTLSGSAAYVKFSNNNGGQQTGDLALTDGGIYFYGVDEVYKPVVELLISLKSNLGSYTYKGKSFTNSICHLTQGQASTFVSTYDTLVSTGGEGIASSVPGSALVTYDTPETSDSHTGEVSLAEIRTALVKKYPAIVGANSGLSIINQDNAAATIIIVISTLSITSLGLFFFLKKRKESR